MDGLLSDQPGADAGPLRRDGAVSALLLVENSLSGVSGWIPNAGLLLTRTFLCVAFFLVPLQACGASEKQQRRRPTRN